MAENGNRGPNDFRSRNGRKRREPPIIDASATEIPAGPATDAEPAHDEPARSETTPDAEPVLFGGALRDASMRSESPQTSPDVPSDTVMGPAERGHMAEPMTAATEPAAAAESAAAGEPAASSGETHVPAPHDAVDAHEGAEAVHRAPLETAPETTGAESDDAPPLRPTVVQPTDVQPTVGPEPRVGVAPASAAAERKASFAPWALTLAIFALLGGIAWLLFTEPQRSGRGEADAALADLKTKVAALEARPDPTTLQASLAALDKRVTAADADRAGLVKTVAGLTTRLDGAAQDAQSAKTTADAAAATAKSASNAAASAAKTASAAQASASTPAAGGAPTPAAGGAPTPAAGGASAPIGTAAGTPNAGPAPAPSVAPAVAAGAVAALAVRLNSVDDRLSAMSDGQTKASKSLADLSGEQAKASKSLADLSGEQAKASKSLADLSGEQAKTAKSIADLSGEQARTAKALADLPKPVAPDFGPIDASVAALDGRFNALEGKVNGNDARLNGFDSKVNGVDAKINGFDTRINKFDERANTVESKADTTAAALAKLQATVISLPKVDLGPLQAQADALAKRVDSVSDALGKRVDGVSDALGKRVDKVESQLSAPKDGARVTEARAVGSADETKATPIALVGQAIESAIAAGQPYGPDLDALKALGVEPEAISKLSPLAAKGAPSAAALKQRWDAVQGDVLLAVKPAEGGNALDRFAASARALVQVQAVGSVTGDDPAAIVSRITAASDDGDIRTALAAWNSLPQAGKDKSSAWAAAARDKVEAATAARDLVGRAIATLGRAKI